MNSYKNIIYEKNDHVAKIIFNRKKKYNALNKEMAIDLINAIEDCYLDDSIKAIIIIGTGNVFFSGVDISYLHQHGATANNMLKISQELNTLYHNFINKIVSLPKPVIASINGVAAGGGLSIVLACDIKIASTNASFMGAFLNVGLNPDGGASFYLPRLVGLPKAFEILVNNNVLTAKDALALGLVNKIVAPENLEDETQRFAVKLAQGPVKAISQTKMLLNSSWYNNLKDHLDRETQGILSCARTKDHVEGINAFLEKREPKFIGE